MRISDWSSDVCSSDLPPEDLVQSRMLQAEAREAVEDLARDPADGGPAVLLGAPWVDDGKLYNARLLPDGGRVVTARYKVDRQSAVAGTGVSGSVDHGGRLLLQKKKKDTHQDNH